MYWTFALGLAFGSGCSSWIRGLERIGATDYDSAEQRARETDRPLLIAYYTGRDAVDAPLQRATAEASASNGLGPYVPCTLFADHEPDRRYAAQYHVLQPPALVVVHSDGTFHSHSGPMSSDAVHRFLTEAKPPGDHPTLNPFIPRRTEYQWHRQWHSAQSAAQQSGRPMLVVMDRALSSDERKLDTMLSRPEVHRRFRDFVHCRIQTFNVLAQSMTMPWGQVRLPAMAVVDGEKVLGVLEMPTTYESVVHFADRCSRSPATVAAPGGDAAAP